MGKSRTRNSIYILVFLYLFSIPVFATSIPQEQKNVYFLNNIYTKPSNVAFSILSANVGNIDIKCASASYKLCDVNVEKRIAANIAELSPTIIVLQEVLAPWQCDTLYNMITCFDKTRNQVQRLVGESYTIACASRNQFECVAVKKGFGKIVGCPIGQYCEIGRTIEPINDCDNGFTISAYSIETNTGISFDVVNFHPQSTNINCRASMLTSALNPFPDQEKILSNPNIILAGDFNFDPWRDKDNSTKVWNDYLNQGSGQFHYHNMYGKDGLPLTTVKNLFKSKTVDFVVSNFASGSLVVLGESFGTSRLDDGEGTDHRALFGYLYLDQNELNP